MWEGFFKVSFHFTEKHREGIASLNISEDIKKEFERVIPAGRLISMIIDVNREEQIEDVLTVVRFKKKLK